VKKIMLLSVLMILGALSMSACGFNVVRGSGNVVTETRQVSDFDSVAFSGSGDVIITQGDAEGLTVEAEENLIPYIRTEVRGRTLHIFMKPLEMIIIRPEKPMRFHVAMKQVNGFDISGSGSVYSKSISTNNLDINISGSGEATIDSLTADGLSIDISGSGKSTLKGTVAQEKIVISGSGSCYNADLASKDVAIDVSGSGKTFVAATDKLDINISGSGDVVYTGVPKLTQKISGSGSIKSN
jgi:hypothetical protein